MPKILFVWNIALSDGNIGSYKPSVYAAKMIGYEIDIAMNFTETPIKKRTEIEKDLGIRLINVEIDRNPYLNEIYDAIIYNYALKVFKIPNGIFMPVSIDDALQFADLLSNSENNPHKNEHKIWAQEIVALLKELYPDNSEIDVYMSSIMSNNGNYRGLSMLDTDGAEISILDRIYAEYDKANMSIPAEPDKQFFKDQKRVYNNLSAPYFSYSGPTSMGKSFIMRMFIKAHIMDGDKYNYVILVPTKALINEVSSKMMKDDLKELLAEYDYKIVTAAGAIALKEKHNFIFVLTPERFLYMMIDHPEIEIDYLFVDEAHKISSKDDRSTFYYKVVDMACRRDVKPHVIFASPNIPNPELYLKLVPNRDFTQTNAIASDYSPVSQIKFFVDFLTNEISLFNNHKKEFSHVGRNPYMDTVDMVTTAGENKQNLVYCSSTSQAIDLALKYASKMVVQNDKELNSISKDIKNEVHGDYYLAEIITKGVAYHVGYLPSTLRMRIEDLYKDGLIKTLFCTSTLVEGVNLPADNLFVMHYKNGRSNMTPVEFKNLIGRVGRLEYSLYGNVFLVRVIDKLEPEKFKELLSNEVPAQKLSLVSELSKPQKEIIIKCLKAGNIEILKHPSNQTADNYSLMRKFAMILLRDITRNKDSVVKKEFKNFLAPGDEDIIRAAFANKKNKPDDDLNVSIDQAENLTYAVEQGLEYPKLRDGVSDYFELLDFLEKLCRIFKWERYESDTLGNRSKKSGDHGMLSWYAVILSQWVQGVGLSFIINRAIEHKEKTAGAMIRINNTWVPYENKIEHKNVVIAEVLSVIENVILFKISNYFLRFSSEYKKIRKVDRVPNDWYEYVEYGTTNGLSILFQQSGFSREASSYIKDHSDIYVIKNADGSLLLKRSLLDCENNTVRKEARELIYNMPEIFEK